jgi:hypothetical protein
MQKGPPAKIFVKKDQLWVAAPPGQATRGTCRLGHCRQAPAAVGIAGMWPGVKVLIFYYQDYIFHAHVLSSYDPSSQILTYMIKIV